MKFWFKKISIFILVMVLITQAAWNFYQYNKIVNINKISTRLVHKQKLLELQQALGTTQGYDEDDITDRLDDLESKIADLEPSQDDIETRIGDLETDLQYLRNEVKKRGGVEYRVAKLEEEIYYLKRKINSY